MKGYAELKVQRGNQASREEIPGSEGWIGPWKKQRNRYRCIHVIAGCGERHNQGWFVLSEKKKKDGFHFQKGKRRMVSTFSKEKQGWFPLLGKKNENGFHF